MSASRRLGDARPELRNGKCSSALDGSDLQEARVRDHDDRGSWRDLIAPESSWRAFELRLARRVHLGFAHEMETCGTRFVFDAPASLEGQWDRLRLEQVITNLLSNALKSGAGKPIEMTIRAQGERARLSVRDHGGGVAPEDQERIFERFTGGTARRWRSRSRRFIRLTQRSAKTPTAGATRAQTTGGTAFAEVPDRLGWLNYWSPAAAKAVGLPDPARDADLLARARQVGARQGPGYDAEV